jgi:hypothetical protein
MKNNGKNFEEAEVESIQEVFKSVDEQTEKFAMAA